MDFEKIKDFMETNKSVAMTLAVVLAVGAVAVSCPRDDRDNVSSGGHYYGGSSGYHGSYYYGGGRRSTVWSSGHTSSGSYSSGSHFSG